ncbi:inorganic phosphate transporter [Paracoccus cavernae]|uniref:inorganic phosphate transporter n=1 Tax=Paracoccus cavernae TaxID=1571207 RepID=UPI0035F2865D
MANSNNDFRILDKDLSRVSNAESASVQLGQSMIRLGIAVLFIALAALISFGAFGGHPGLGIIVAGVAVSAYLALSIGANDVSNSLGPAVGAGAIGMTSGLVLVGVMQVAGAVFAGGEVTNRLGDGIVIPMIHGETSGRMMLAALLAAATWISLATWASAPVSTTHSIVGAIAGAGITLYGWQAVNWPSMAMIATGWVLSPLLSGLIAALLLAFFRKRIYEQQDRQKAARRWLPWLIGMLGVLFTLNLFKLALGFAALPSMLAALGVGALGWWYAGTAIDRQFAREQSPRAAMKAIFALPLVISALAMGFAHGSNDAANVIAPLSAVLLASDGPVDSIAAWSPLLAGLGIAGGAMLFGRRLVHMVGSRITRLNASRAFCVSVATAATVIGASSIGLPVSTTHVAVGGVFGVGFYREWEDRRAQRDRAPLPDEEHKRRHLVRRSHMRTIFGAWLVTVPASALLAAGCAWLIA